MSGMPKALILILSGKDGGRRRSSRHMLRADVLFFSNISDAWLVEYMDTETMDEEAQVYPQVF